MVEKPMNITTNEETIRMINMKNSAKLLVSCISPSLSWKDEFGRVKQKMKSAIKKPMRLNI